MRAVYRLEAAAPVDWQGWPGPLRLDNGSSVEWQVEEGRLVAARLVLFGVALVRDPTSGTILTATPEIEQRAFRAACFVADSVFVQTTVDVFDPYRVVHGSPEIEPENPDEEREFAGDGRRRIRASRTLQWRTEGPFDPSTFTPAGATPSALANFADGLRAKSPFIRYEQMYKVIEHYFPDKTGAHLDRAVSAYLSTIDPAFTEDEVRAIRETRIRSMHAMPRSAGQHLSPRDLEDIREVTDKLPRLRTLALSLLRNPPRTGP